MSREEWSWNGMLDDLLTMLAIGIPGVTVLLVFLMITGDSLRWWYARQERKQEEQAFARRARRDQWLVEARKSNTWQELEEISENS